MKYFHVLFIGFVVVLVSLLGSCSLVQAGDDVQVAEQKKQSNTGDVQEVTLSWGKFNYNPETIRVTEGKPVRIIADLTRLQGCYRTFVIADLGIETYFDKGSESVEFTPTEKGTFQFTCAMGMGRGTLIIE